MTRIRDLQMMLLSVLVTVLPGSLVSAGSCAADDRIDLRSYIPTFLEDFDTLDVSPWGKTATRWIAHTPWAGDFGDARFTDPRPGFPFTVQHGILRIEAHKNEQGRWESGLLSLVNPQGMGFAQAGGYFEARMKLPCGEGVWPAFWLVGVDRSQYTAEIDVLEYYGRNPAVYQVARHVWYTKQKGNDAGALNTVKVDAGSLCLDFHTYGVDIGAARLTFYLDRISVMQMALPDEFRGVKFYPLDRKSTRLNSSH